MKAIILSVLIVLISCVCYSQTIDGIDITNFRTFDYTEKYYYRSFNPDTWSDIYVMEKLEHFSLVELHPNERIIFFKFNPTGNNFYDIYNHVVDMLGEEDYNNDTIPAYLNDNGYDYDTLLTYIENGEAKICRTWLLKNDYNLDVTLYWDIIDIGVDFIRLEVKKDN